MSSLLKNTAYYTIGNFISKAVNFLLLPLYTSYLMPDEYGIVVSMQVFSGILLIFLTLGLERAIYRLFFDYKTFDDQKKFLGTISISISIVSLFVVIALFWFQGTVEQLFKSIDFYPYFSYAIITALFMTYELVPKIILQVRERANHYLLISIVTLLFRIIPILWQVVYLEAGAIGMLKGAMYGSGATLIFLIPITLKNIKINFNYSIFKKTMAYCLPLIPMVASAWVVNMSDRLFIEHYMTTYDVGIYSLGYKMGEVVQFLAVSLLMAYNPYFYKLANTQDQTFAKKQLYKLNNLSIIFLLFISFIVAIFSKDVLLLFFNENYFEAYKIVPLIILGYFFIQLVSLQSLSFHQAKKTLPIMIINVVAAVINLLLNYLLIKKYGVFGAALSTVFTQSLLFIIIYYFSKRYYFIPYNFKIIVPIFFALVFIYLVNILYLPVTYYFFIGKILTVLTLISIAFLYNKKHFHFSFNY